MTVHQIRNHRTAIERVTGVAKGPLSRGFSRLPATSTTAFKRRDFEEDGVSILPHIGFLLTLPVKPARLSTTMLFSFSAYSRTRRSIPLTPLCLILRGSQLTHRLSVQVKLRPIALLAFRSISATVTLYKINTFTSLFQNPFHSTLRSPQLCQPSHLNPTSEFT